MNMDSVLQVFLDESRELLSDMERILLELESRAGDTELLNALFRCVHTIKGSAGMFGLKHVVEFTHVVENVLDRLRAGEIELDNALANLLLRCRDHISLLVEIMDTEEAASLSPTSIDLLVELQPFQSIPTADVTSKTQPKPVATRGKALWRIVMRVHSDALRHGMDPLGFIRFLNHLGQVQAVSTDKSQLPALADFDAESCYLSFEVILQTSAGHQEIADVFEIAGDLYQLEINMLTDEQMSGQVNADAANNPIPVAGVHVDSDVSHESNQQKNRRRKPIQHFRIQADKLDKLINLVGELVIASASVNLDAHRSGDSGARESAATLNQLVEEIRNSALDLRMVPIGDTFQRFQRVVRDIASELGKDIDLSITGADTELDKTVVEKIGDPLTHLVRNACDHGVESPEQRRNHGKSAQGRVLLNAYHESGAIVIEVSDDGAGLNREKILDKAVERGLVNADANLTDSEVFDLIFEPGFSTKEKVTNLSGRGVGMDVVRRNIESLRGQVELVSPGVMGGTTFRIRLPLTLAIIDSFLARVGEATYVVPLEMVVECTDLRPDQRGVDGNQQYINLRQEVLPLICLREHLSLSGERQRRQNIIVVRHGGQKAGLIVDELLGEHQTVIKPLGGLFAHLKGLSGSTILGSGQVALILDVPGLIQQVTQYEDAASRGKYQTARPQRSASYQ